MYCEYWNLSKAPFDNVPDPSMYADCHTSMENVISDTIFAIKEGNESFAVIVGAVGLGKTLSLRIIIDALEPDKYKVVLVTNPSLTFSHLLREIIGQITGKPCEENRKVDLLEMFNQLIFATMDRGQKIVIFIDEANALSPANLENLRLLTNMQDDQRNLFTLVLAGQLELAQRLEHPKRANLFQRIGTYGRIDKLPAQESVKTYIETRLKLAGTNVKIFADECVPVIWEYSEHGVPRLINKICKLCLKAGEIDKLDYITPDLVSQISERFQKLSKTAVQKRRPRNRTEIDLEEQDISASSEVDELTSIASSFDTSPVLVQPREETVPVLPFSQISRDEITSENDSEIRVETKPSAHVIPPEDIYHTEPKPIFESIVDAQAFQPEELITKPLMGVDEPPPAESIPATLAPSEPVIALAEESFREASEPETGDSLIDMSISATPDACATEKRADRAMSSIPVIQDGESEDILIIGEYRIQMGIPKDILIQVKKFNRESANKSAGFWAAQIIKKNPQLMQSPQADPVYLWNEIKDSILKKIAV